MDSPGHWGHFFLPSLLSLVCEILIYNLESEWPRGLMDKASDFESEDCEFESRRGRNNSFLSLLISSQRLQYLRLAMELQICAIVRMAERSKALRSGRSRVFPAWVRIPLLT